MTVYVVGAGVSGLVTAERLLALGRDVIVIEREAHVGGASASFSWHGIPGVDLGPHIWHTPDADLAEEWRSRFGDLLEQGKFFGKNVVNRDDPMFFDYPVSMQAVRQLPADDRHRILRELDARSTEDQVAADSFASYVEALVGPSLAKMFFLQYPEKLWGIPVTTMSADWAPKRIRLTESTEDFHAGQWSAVGVRGSGAIVDRIAESVLQAGGQLHFEAEVSNIQSEGGRLTSLTLRRRHGDDFKAESVSLSPQDLVVSTAPLPIVASWLGIPTTLRYRGAYLVFLYLSRSEVIPGEASFLYFGDSDTTFHRLSEQKKFSAKQFPDSRTVLTAEVAFSVEDRPLADPQELASRVVEDCVSWGLINEQDVLDTKVLSLPYVYPVLTQESRAELSRVLGDLKAFRQLHLIGTGGEFHYADIQILFQKGMELADRIAREDGSPSLGMTTTSTPFDDRVRPANPESLLGDQGRPFVIAEVGLNHGGNFNLAKDMLARLAEAGTSFVKFQTYGVDSRVSSRLGANRYAETLQGIEEGTNEMFNRFRFSQDEWSDLFLYGRELGLTVFSAPFDLDSLAMLEAMDCPFYKIASMDVNNYPLLREVAQTGKEIVLSTGMSSLVDIERAVSVIEAAGNSRLILLHCVSQYPANPNDLNLKAMETLRTAFGYPVGFSDHSVGLVAATVALALGAAGIERHYTLNRLMEGPDHLVSSEDEEFRRLIELSDEVPRILGHSRVRITGGERDNAYLFKKSLHARADLEVGKVLEIGDVAIKAPYAGIDPYELPRVVGRRVRRSVQADEAITWDQL